MAKNDVKVTDNPKLKQKKLSDGTISLYLDYYLGRFDVKDEVTGEVRNKVQRKREALSLYLSNAKTPLERQQNKETIELAHQIRYEREQQFLKDKEGYRIGNNTKDINFLTYFQNFIDHYTKKDKRNVQLALNRFKSFLKVEYKGRFERTIKPAQITKDMVLAFAERLQEDCKGEGARSIFARFSKVIKYAVEHDVMIKNPCAGISIKVDYNVLKKEILLPEEITTLLSTPCHPQENRSIRRAFITSLFTGLRFCDIKALTFENIDYSNKLLKFEQSKTKGHSANSSVVIPLRDDMLQLIGKPTNENDKAELIFKLPSHTMCNKAILHLCQRAGIKKKITWHCARHSFCMNGLLRGFDVKTMASLMGHSGLRYIEKYSRALDSRKKEAIFSQQEIDISNI